METNLECFDLSQNLAHNLLDLRQTPRSMVVYDVKFLISLDFGRSICSILFNLFANF